MSDANRLGLAYINESVFGTTPSGPPTLKNLRFTKESLAMDIDTKTSEEIIATRQITDVIRTDIKGAGDIEFELSWGSYDDFFQYALQSAGWSNGGTAVTYTLGGTTLTFATPANTITRSAGSWIPGGGAVASTDLQVGQWIKVTGSVSNNNYFKITAITATVITVATGTPVVAEVATASCTVVEGSQITNGTTLTSLAIEKVFTDIASEFSILNGMCIDGMDINVDAGSILKGKFMFMGKKETSAAVTAGSGTNTAVSTTPVMNAIDDVISINEASGVASMASFAAKNFGFSLKNNLRARTQIATLGPISMGSGTVGVTGKLEAYYTSKAIMDKFLNFTASALALILDDTNSKAYVFDFPQVKYTNGQRVAGGINTDIIAQMEWTAYRHATEAITCRIARF